MAFKDKFKNMIGLDDEEFDVEEIENEDVVAKKPTRKVVQMTQRNNTGGSRLVVHKILTLDDTEKVAQALKEKTSCVCNLQRCDQATSTRVIDFLSGTSFALDGQIKEVGLQMYLCTPNGTMIEETSTNNESVNLTQSSKEESDLFKYTGNTDLN